MDDAVLHNSQCSFACSKPSEWAELISWSVCKTSLSCLGFNDEAETAWKKVGIPVESTVCMGQSNLLKRRKLLELLLSASQAHGWSPDEVAQGNAFGLVISDALIECQSTLDEVKKKQLKTKRGALGTLPFLEPSPLIVEYVMSNPNQTMCLHLSNLQRMPLEQWHTQKHPNGCGVAMSVMEVREFYASITQNKDKTIEAIKGIHDCHLTLWAPEKQEHIALMINALTEVSKTGANPELTFLVPYNPLPGCVKPEHITDLWGHYLLSNKFRNMIKQVVFIKEASRMVFTSDSSPTYQNKNLAAITYSGNCLQDGQLHTVRSMRPILLSDNPIGEVIVIDCPQHVCNAIYNKLCNITINAEDPMVEGIKWTINRRSPGSSKKDGFRSSIFGQTQSFVKCYVLAVVKMIREKVYACQGIDCEGNIGPIGHDSIVGRIGMFTDPWTVIAHCDIAKFHHIYCQCDEAVVVTPNKLIITPSSSGNQLSTILTENEDLANVTIRFRQSSPQGGKEFAKPNKLPDHLRAMRIQNLSNRLPQHKVELLKAQVQIEVHGINGQHNENAIDKIIEAINTNVVSFGENDSYLLKAKDFDEPLEAGEWAPVLRDGGVWTGRILIQPYQIEDVATIHHKIDHTQICIQGTSYSIHVSTPFDSFLASRMLEERVQSIRLAQGAVGAGASSS